MVIFLNGTLLQICPCGFDLIQRWAKYSLQAISSLPVDPILPTSFHQECEEGGLHFVLLRSASPEVRPSRAVHSLLHPRLSWYGTKAAAHLSRWAGHLLGMLHHALSRAGLAVDSHGARIA